MPRVALIFVDGIGIGENDPVKNPFIIAKLPVLTKICNGKIPTKPFSKVSSKYAEVIALDASLGIEGLPQSGTNQVTIFTGVNGAKIFGRHFGPYAPSVLQPVLKEKNIFTKLKKEGKSVVFVNAYPKEFFEYVKSGTRRLSVTTLCCKYANIPLLTKRELLLNKAVSSDLNRKNWITMGYSDIKIIKPFEAGKHFAGITHRNDLSIFEYWLPDLIGHSKNIAKAVKILENFDQFVDGFLKFIKEKVLSIIISDHGNIEDCSVKTHTNNKVICIIMGKDKKIIINQIKTLMDIAPSIVKYLKT